MAHKTEEELLAQKHNVARFFVENKHISWVLLLVTVLWGAYGYKHMPQRKDPDIPVRIAVAMCPWPGVKADKIEELVARKIEARIAENQKVERIESITRTGLAVITVRLLEDTKDTSETFDDINLKLNGIQDLPEGAGPITFMKDFGDTAALMLTVASPPAGEVEIDLRAQEVEAVIRALRPRGTRDGASERVSIVAPFSYTPLDKTVRRGLAFLAKFLTEKKVAEDILLHHGSGVAILDAATPLDNDGIKAILREFMEEFPVASVMSPDIWDPAIIRDPAETRAKLTSVAGNKYSYRELEAYTDEIARTLQAVPRVSKVSRWGVQKETIFLEYSQERLASYRIQPWKIKDVLGARNMTVAGGTMELGTKNLVIDPTGEFKTESELGEALITATSGGAAVYLRDLVDIDRSYETPPQNINYLSARDASGRWHRMRAITLAVNMRASEQIGFFSKDVDEALAALKTRLPEDLIIARTSDQPQQVRESVGLFMNSLYEAIALVVLVALVGFWEWRSAVLMALSIPITMSMTFGMLHMLNVDLQQVSIASLIIALGLLVDDPVVANDAIKNELDRGRPSALAAWLGPTKLAKAILYATITNIVAYLPYLILKGDTGRFLYYLPVVLTCSLVSSRIVSMTFVPLIGYYLLRPHTASPPSPEIMRATGFYALYWKVGGLLIDHRWKALLVSLTLVAAGFALRAQLKPQFFPKDLSYLSYVDVWLPEDTPVKATEEAARLAEKIIR
jgi:multidrug efflux pump subunit AcrB